MSRLFTLLLILTCWIAVPVSARLIVVKQHVNTAEPCVQPPSGPLECTFRSALVEAPLSGQVDTIAIARGGDTARTVSAAQSFADVNKPVVLIDSSFLATGNVRYRIDGLGLRFLASPVRIEGFSFTRTGSNRSSVSLLGPGPDVITRNLFNLEPGNAVTLASTYTIYGLLVGPKNLKSRITENKFGTFGNNASIGRAATIYGDSTQILDNRFGMDAAGGPVLFNASAIDIGATLTTGQGGAPDTNYSPVGGTVRGNRIATCSEWSSGIIVGGGKAEGGTRGWMVTGNGIGMSATDSTKKLVGCSASLNELYAGIVLSSSDISDSLTANTVIDNRIYVVANGIVVKGPKAKGNTIKRNLVGVPNETITSNIISYNGIFLHGGANNNFIDSNTIGGSSMGIRLAWGTGYGDAIDNTMRGNVIGAATAGGPTNDTGFSLGYTSSGNLIENNQIVGNRHQGMVFSSFNLLPNRIERNRFGVTTTGALRPNGGSGIKSSSGASRQVVRNNVFGPSTAWGIEITAAATRASLIDSNRFMAGQDSGGILLQGTDSVRIVGNLFDSCSVSCVQIRGAKYGLISRNRFGGTKPALIAKAHPTQSFLVTASVLDSNVLPSIPVPVDLIPTAGLAGYTPNDVGDADEGPMGLLNHPLIQSATIQGDSLVLLYNLDLGGSTTSPRIQVYAKLPDSTVLLPLGSRPAAAGTGTRLAIYRGIVLPTGTRIRAGLTDAAGNSSEIDTGRVASGGTGIAYGSKRLIQENRGVATWAGDRLTLDLNAPSKIEWRRLSLDGTLLDAGYATLEAGRHAVPIAASPEPTLLRVRIDGHTALSRLLPIRER